MHFSSPKSAEQYVTKINKYRKSIKKDDKEVKKAVNFSNVSTAPIFSLDNRESTYEVGNIILKKFFDRIINRTTYLTF